MNNEAETYLYYLDQRLTLSPGRVYTIGRSSGSDVMLPHMSVSRQHASITWSEEGFLLVDLGSTNGVIVNNRKSRKKLLVDGDNLRIGSFHLQFVIHNGADEAGDFDSGIQSPTLAMERPVAELLQNVNDPDLVAQILEMKQSFDRKREELADLAFKDTLTRIFNRRYFDSKLVEEIETCRSAGRPLSLIMIDIDHFKAINDTYGHQRGDQIVRYVAGVICGTVRSDDTVARYGGEEMAVILPGVDIENGLRIAERFRLAVVEELPKLTGLQVTISLGVAHLTGEIKTPEKLISGADRALYKAKENGRNQVVAAD